MVMVTGACNVSKENTTSIPDNTRAAAPTTTPTHDEMIEEPSTAPLDLRFANVTRVEFTRLDEGSYRFDVTLYHDDDGEAPNFADAWQVLDLDGNLLGIRELLHSHGTQPFTRSATIEVPEGVSLVLVRGHDMVHGFGGQGMLVDLETGSNSPLEIPPE